ncbi:MAG: ATP-binding cassette domain-containing protein [Bacteroidota bacterium]|nr:ATP-binding cassette domain-containing protein [Bacteroidota bacterium]
MNKEEDIIIAINDVEKSFNGISVLNGITINIHKGENVAILGRSGSGKSVLIKIIAGLLLPDKGSVHVLGMEVNTLNARELQQLRLKIGFSFQSSALYDSMTVKENLQFPLIRNKRHLTGKEVNEAINNVLESIGLLDTLHKMPAELSGGQRKRIGIARTLILNPEIMLYDEPTSGLDPITCVEINHLIKHVQEQYNTTSIIITHDLTCAKTTADNIAIIADGKFVSQGKFNEVFHTADKRVKGFYDYNFITMK